MNEVEKVKHINLNYGITQKVIADELGITQAALNRWLNGKAAPRESMKHQMNTLFEKYTDADLDGDTDKLLLSKIMDGNLEHLDGKIYSEAILGSLASNIAKLDSYQEVVTKLITEIPLSSRIFDWNVGSILQHFDPISVLDIFKKIDNHSPYYNSIGLSWVFGELDLKDQKVIDYLISIVNYSTDSDAWWRAAFSLEKLEFDDAVNLMKRSLKMNELKSIESYLSNISDKKSVICTLVLSNVDNIERIIYPRIKKIFLRSNDIPTLISCCWLIGRLNLIDDTILPKLLKLTEHRNYELKYYTFFALQNNTNEVLLPIFEKSLSDPDALIRKMASRAIRSHGSEASIPAVEAALHLEKEQSVISELSQTIYSLRNPMTKLKQLIREKTSRNENGLISDETDKWYKDSALYNLFSEAEDPQNVCFNIIINLIRGMRISNPIDLATGTGRMVWQLIEKVNFTGTLFAADNSSNMCDYLKKAVKRNRGYTKNIKVIHSSIENLPNKIHEKSSLVISSFGFPSRISDTNLCMNELRSVSSLLADDGLFITLGWDETFNDQLNEMWFKHIPDNIRAKDFEEWRRKRSGAITSARNCGLTWVKKGIHVPLQFSSVTESANVMGYLFGRDAVEAILTNSRTEWIMSLGITLDNKKSIDNIISSYERSRNIS